MVLYCYVQLFFLLFLALICTNYIQGQSDSRTYDNELPNIISSSLPSFIRLNTEYLRSKDEEDTKKAISNASFCGITECQRQFKDEKWNCSLLSSSLQRTAKLATRESAFLYAIFAASLSHILSQIYLKGLTQECGYKLDKTTGSKEGSFASSPLCSDENLKNSVKYGIDRSRELLASKKIRDARWQMDEHNKEAGRVALELPKLSNSSCTCHGVSGACALKKCVKTLPTFEVIGSELKKKYTNAIKAGPDNNGQLITYTKFKPEKSDLIYMSDSPDFCINDISLGVIGTKGRKCSSDANAPDSCEKLCCNRGFTEISLSLTKTCECKFHYCCRIDCNTCQHNVTQFRCN